MVRERAVEECKTIGEAYDEGYQQGREDTIDEFVKEFESSIKSEVRRTYWWPDTVVRLKNIAGNMKGVD